MSRFIYVPCVECGGEMGFANNSVQYKLHNDTGLLTFVCSEGHTNNVVVQNFDFEILLGMALESMSEGYYRDAIFNFASALERCREFAIELICFEKGLSSEKYTKLWNCMKNQSERQLGAFISLFSLRFDIDFVENDNMQKIRNDVVHKGKIIKRGRATTYGEYVLSKIQNIVATLMLNVDKKTFSDFVLKKNETKAAQVKNGSIITMHMGIISFRTATDEELAAEKKLGEYSRSHPQEYAAMACRANTVGKSLCVNNKNELVLIETPDPFLRNPGEKYVGSKNLEQAIKSYMSIKQHYNMAESGRVKGTEIRTLEDVFES